MTWVYDVVDGTRSRPAGYIGTYETREEAEQARFRLCRCGGYIKRLSTKPKNLNSRDLRKADMRSANLRGASLMRAILDLARLKGAVLEYAFLYETSLRCCDLRRTRLTGANLRCADLRGADLRGAEGLLDAYLRGATYDADTMWPEYFCPEGQGMHCDDYDDEDDDEEEEGGAR